MDAKAGSDSLPLKTDPPAGRLEPALASERRETTPRFRAIVRILGLFAFALFLYSTFSDTPSLDSLRLSSPLRDIFSFDRPCHSPVLPPLRSDEATKGEVFHDLQQAGTDLVQWDKYSLIIRGKRVFIQSGPPSSSSLLSAVPVRTEWER